MCICLDVQDDDELGLPGMEAHFRAKTSPGKGLQDVWGLCLFSIHDRMPRRDLAESTGAIWWILATA